MPVVPALQEAEGGESQVRAWPGQLSKETLSQKGEGQVLGLYLFVKTVNLNLKKVDGKPVIVG